jgi:hypothetical protein
VKNVIPGRTDAEPTKVTLDKGSKDLLYVGMVLVGTSSDGSGDWRYEIIEVEDSSAVAEACTKTKVPFQVGLFLETDHRSREKFAVQRSIGLSELLRRSFFGR